ncbi:MAG: histidine phosphatase family protein [Alphaproteobacteria bacterium]|nr:histidine phosphatase family protein [Alphaproteobacteria bacterium]
MKTTLLIARHGNTFAPGAVITRVGAKTDLPLVQSGIEQGLQLGSYMKSYNLVPDIVYTSNLMRTKQTASYALESMGVFRPVHENSLFNEVDYGIDENKPEEAVIARIGKAALKAWDEEAKVPYGWNINVREIINGWLKFGETVRAEHEGKTVLVVTSNGIARFAPYLTGNFEGSKKQHNIKLSTGALCHLVNGSASKEWAILGWNIKPLSD